MSHLCYIIDLSDHDVSLVLRRAKVHLLHDVAVVVPGEGDLMTGGVQCDRTQRVVCDLTTVLTPHNV